MTRHSSFASPLLAPSQPPCSSQLLGHVLRALVKRMDGAEDKEVRRHAAHESATGDVLGTFDVGSESVVLDLLSLEAGAPALKQEHDGRATYYAALMIASMAKYKAGRVYLVGEGGGQGGEEDARWTKIACTRINAPPP